MNVNLPLPWDESDVRQGFFDNLIGRFLAGPQRPERLIGTVSVFHIFNFSIGEDFFQKARIRALACVRRFLQIHHVVPDEGQNSVPPFSPACQ